MTAEGAECAERLSWFIATERTEEKRWNAENLHLITLIALKKQVNQRNQVLKIISLWSVAFMVF